MVGNVILYFSTLAAAFRLKSPLPPYLPPAEDSRQRLVSHPTHLYTWSHTNIYIIIFLGWSYQKTRCSQKQRHQRFSTTSLLRVCSHDAGCDSRTRLSGTYTSRGIWSYRRKYGCVWRVVQGDGAESCLTLFSSIAPTDFYTSEISQEWKAEFLENLEGKERGECCVWCGWGHISHWVFFNVVVRFVALHCLIDFVIALVLSCWPHLLYHKYGTSYPDPVGVCL